MLNYCLMVTGPAYGNQRSRSALQFSQTLLKCNHRLSMIFFYQDGVLNANSFSTLASDEVNLVHAWQHLAKQNQITLYVCTTAALRRGIIDSTHASLLKKTGENLQPGFELSGLVNLVQMILTCDRFVQF
ncbi:sulfurtransferase complex subunit TusD [Sodalis sp. CWE]|uniref:sulfurtransferase complex subunit TusD n=1 Tax=Sodalis sp. CWE TaxID=2803816 RepID=UPI001C7CE3FB|nr:sulfurtransferase complex subunit TusD [Sodalis sp. CWE]MBX4180733.1 sulfurtransferase complex subunit TusD [Sodalis sp. CWE]